MIIEFDQNDDLTRLLKAKGYTVSEYFVPDTMIPLGYTFSMQNVRFVYHVKNSLLFLVSFDLIRKSKGIKTVLRDFYRLFMLAKSVPSIKEGQVLVNQYPTEEQKKEQEILLKFARKLGGKIVHDSPVNFIMMDLQ